MVRVTGTPAVSWELDSVALRTLLVVAMVLVWTHPVCQCPSAALRRSRTPDRWRLRKHWRRSSPFPVLVVVSGAGPAWAGARSLHGYLRSGASGARIVRTSLTSDRAVAHVPPWRVESGPAQSLGMRIVAMKNRLRSRRHKAAQLLLCSRFLYRRQDPGQPRCGQPGALRKAARGCGRWGRWGRWGRGWGGVGPVLGLVLGRLADARAGIGQHSGR